MNTIRHSRALLALAGLLLALLAVAPLRPALAAERVLVNDPLNGSTVGSFIGRGGEFVAGGGWRSSGATIVLDAGQQITNGYFEATMRGYTVPAGGASKSHPLSCWETAGGYTHHREPGAFWNWRIGTNYEVFKVLASYQGLDPLPNDPTPREEARVGTPDMVNDGKPHVYRVEWNAGKISFLIDGKLLKSWDLPRFSVRYCTIGRDRFYNYTRPAPIISNVRIVTRDGATTPTPTPSPTATPQPGGPVTLSNLAVNDSTNAAAWSLQSNLQNGDLSYGDRRDIFLSGVPASLAGSAWVRSANNSKWATNDPLATFSISRDADVYVGLDTRVAPPAWLAGWADTGASVTSGTATLRLYSRRFSAGQVALGPLGGSGPARSMYIVVVK